MKLLVLMVVLIAALAKIRAPPFQTRVSEIGSGAFEKITPQRI
jgi:hypothetical protein